MNFQEFLSSVAQLEEEKGLSKEVIIEGVEHALASAYKKEYGKKGQIIKGRMNVSTGEVDFFRTRLVVDQTMVYIPLPKEDEEPENFPFVISEEYRPLDHEINFVDDPNQNIVVRDDRRVRYNPEKHILIEEVQVDNLGLTPREELIIPLEKKDDFGRIAAQTAKQVVLQKIREAEKNAVIAEYRSKEGEVVSGVIQKIEGLNIYFDIGKTTGVLMKEEQIRGEFYKEGQRLKLYVVKVDTTPKGPIIVLSRAYPKLVSKLFELEVPEISAGQVEIKSLAREPGSRTKIAVASCMEGIDPIGSMVGQRGTRVATVINELGGEKIDVVEYSDDPVDFIKNALSPAKVLEVMILPKNTALVIVPNDQLSLAIGKDGQNVRLSARLTGWKIEVKSLDEYNKLSDEEELDIDNDDVAGEEDIESNKEIVSEEENLEEDNK